MWGHTEQPHQNPTLTTLDLGHPASRTENQHLRCSDSSSDSRTAFQSPLTSSHPLLPVDLSTALRIQPRPQGPSLHFNPNANCGRATWACQETTGHLAPAPGRPFLAARFQHAGTQYQNPSPLFSWETTLPTRATVYARLLMPSVLQTPLTPEETQVGTSPSPP